MNYRSVEEICKEFEISSSLSIPDIIAELTKKQKDLHPDVNPNYTESDAETLSRIESAKKYLRSLESQTLIPLSDVLTIIKSVKNVELTTVEQEEKIQQNIATTSERIKKSIRNYYLPRKLTVAGILTLVTFIWSFPSLITEHPLFKQLLKYSYDLTYDLNIVYIALTSTWLLVLVFSLCLLFLTFKNETFIKNVLHSLDNIQNQYTLFHKFTKQLCNESFTTKQLEEYIYNDISSKPHIPKQLLPHIRDISPKIAEIIVLRASEKGVIKKENKSGWYDTYHIESF